MSTTTTVTQPASTYTKQPSHITSTQPSPSTFRTIDGLLKSHAADASNPPLIGYPGSGVSDFEEYTARDLDRFADAVVANYINHGLMPADATLKEAPVVALLATSSLEVMISVFALNRMGYAILFLSTRLSAPAYIQLLEMSNCNRIIASPPFQSMVDSIHISHPCTRYPLVTRSAYCHVSSTFSIQRTSLNLVSESHKTAWIIHSSGSTGFPKPIFLTNAQCLANFSKGLGLRTFCTSPLFHSQALMETGRALYAKKTMYLGNYAFPVTRQNLIQAMSVAKPEMFNVVPYVLKLLAETPEGMAQLQQTKLVLYAGSACPDALGDRLVAAGVNLVGNYGATETGFIMNSFRPPGDIEWNYMRLHHPLSQHTLMDEISPGVFECVALDGLPSKGPSNSDDPPNSFRTRDLFTRHPDANKSNYWKYLSRLDDRLTLVNGEKVLPIPIEGRVRQDTLVREVAVFGAGKSLPGAIIFRNEHSANMTDAEFFQAVKPSLDEANAVAESFSRIPEELVILMSAEVEYPKTDKGTFIRAQLYQVFEQQIEAAYAAFELGASNTNATDNSTSEPLLKLTIPELETFLLETFATKLNVQLPSADADVFAAGVDSLQTLRLYGILKQKLDLGGDEGKAKLSTNVVFEKGNVAALARHLYCLRTGEEEIVDGGVEGAAATDDIAIMQSMIDEFSVFPAHQPSEPPSPTPTGAIVLVTGCTGSLGAYIANTLLSRSTVSHVYALVRASDAENARQRVLSQLKSRNLDLSEEQLSRLTCLPSDLTSPTLGLEPTQLQTLRASLTHVIHSAWSVNFSLPIASFRPQIQGLHNLISLCLSTSHAAPAGFYFCSSVSSAAGTPRPATIGECAVKDLAHAQKMGYGKSKLVGEWITRNAMVGSKGKMEARVLRIGQLSADRRDGVWNETEAVSLMVRSAVSTRSLPLLDERVSWLPVDMCAEGVVDIALGGKDEGPEAERDTELVYHLLNPHSFHWTREILPALRKTGLPTFEAVEPLEWLRRLRESEQDAAKNPSIKLLAFWEGKYGTAVKSDTVEEKQQDIQQQEEEIPEGQDGSGKLQGQQNGIKFETHRTLVAAPVVGTADEKVMLGNEEGYLEKVVQKWMDKWHVAA